MTPGYPAETYGRPRTPYAIFCIGLEQQLGCGHGLVYLTDAEYDAELNAADDGWHCPLCGTRAEWSDSNYDDAAGEVHDR